jgi:hypothetical protein
MSSRQNFETENSSEDIFTKFDDESDREYYRKIVNEQAKKELTPQNFDRRNQNLNFGESGVYQGGTIHQNQNQIQNQISAPKSNPYEILDKINSYNNQNRIQNQNSRLGYKKPGLTSMGYSQRAIFDKDDSVLKSNSKMTGFEDLHEQNYSLTERTPYHEQ